MTGILRRSLPGLFIVGVLLLGTACGGRSAFKARRLDGSTPTDGPGHAELRVDKGARDLPRDSTNSFCTGTQARLERNGTALAVTKVTGDAGPPMSCCYAPTVRFASMVGGQAFEMLVTARMQVGSAVMPPATIDLAKPPAGWVISMSYYPCSPYGQCKVGDQFTTGSSDKMSGWLEVKGKTPGTFTVSLCISGQRSSSTPGGVVDRFRLYATNVKIPAS